MKTGLMKKALAILMIVSLAVTLGGFSAYAEESTTAPQEESTTQVTAVNEQTEEEKEKALAEAQKTLEEQRAELEEKLKESEDKLKEFGDSAESTEAYINALDEKSGYLNEELILLENEVNDSNAKIAELDAQIAPLEKELAALQAEFDAAKKEYDRLSDNFEITYKAYCLRLRAMYISGSTSIIVALLTSDDISQFLSRFEMIKAVSKSDTKLLKELNKQMEELVTKQDGLDAKKAELDIKKAELDVKKAEYKANQEAVQSKLNEIANKKLVLADERAKCDTLFMEYATKNQIYLDFADDSEDAIANLDAEIDALLNGTKSAEEVTTAVAPELKDGGEVTIESQTGDVFSGSNAALSLGWPVPGHRSVSQEFGHVRYGKAHGGMDIPCPSSTAVVAAQKGIVIRSEYHSSYGYYVMVYHGTDAQGRRITTLYAHNSVLRVKVGATVNKGDILALSGSTGNSTGPHCHFEVRIGDTRVNPRSYVL